METTYEYFKSVFMPFAYTGTKYIPDIPYQGVRRLSVGSASDKTYIVPPGGNVEALLVSPCLVTGTYDSSFSELVSFFSVLNPTLTGGISSRYGTTSDTMNLGSSSQVPMYLHKACGSISATGPVTYEACMFVKTLATTAETPDQMFSLHATVSGVLQPSDNFWINTLPVYFEKNSLDNTAGVYRQGTCVHYLVRITNNGTTNTTVYVTGSSYIVGERDGVTTNDGTLAIKSSPLGFTQYVLEKLRSKHCFMVLDKNDTNAVTAKKTEIETDIKQAITELAQDWYDLMKAVPGIDLTKLINFIIFYLE